MGQLFLPLLGNWTGLEKQEASPWAPATSARASFAFKLGVGGTIVVQDYRQVRADGAEFLGHGVFLAEPPAERVLWWFFDSDAQPPVPASGAWQGAELVCEKVTGQGHAQHRFRAAADRLDYQILIRLADADTWSPFLTGTYSRISGH